MWRIIQRGFWLKHSTSVKSSTQIVSCCDECRKKAVFRHASVHCATSQRFNYGADQDDSSRERDANGSEDGAAGGPDCKEHMRYFRHDMWSSGHPCYYLEAIGWGTAVVLGVQMSTLCHRRHCRGSDGSWCHCSLLTTGRPHGDKFDVSKWFTSHVRYTAAAVVSRLFLPDVQRAVRRILPASAVPSGSVAEADDTSTSDASSCTCRHETNDRRDAESDEFQNELRDFIRGLHIPSAAETSGQRAEGVDSVADEWRRLVGDYVCGIHSNVLALKHARTGDYRAAARIWLRASRSRCCDGKILFNLAVCYQNGLGVTRDLAKAMECYTKAAELDHARSAHNLAVLHLRSAGAVHQQEALRLLEQAAGLGLKEAQRELGVLFTEPDHRDMQRAVALFKNAAEQQDVSATYYLGICHERGLGTVCNEAKAAELYRVAASHGHRGALHNLAVFSENGVGGVPQNKVEAVRLYQEAAVGGAAAAAERLKVLQPHRPQLKCTNKGAEVGSSGREQLSQTTHGAVVSRETTHRAVDSRPKLSRFYRSLSFNSEDASSDSEADRNLLEMTANESSTSSRQRSQTFFLENSSSDDEASPPAESRTSVRRHADTDTGKTNPPPSSSSAEFGRLLRMMFRREGGSCVSQQDRPPPHHGSLGSFVVPQGSFGGDVVPHVSSFG